MKIAPLNFTPKKYNPVTRNKNINFEGKHTRRIAAIIIAGGIVASKQALNYSSAPNYVTTMEKEACLAYEEKNKVEAEAVKVQEYVDNICEIVLNKIENPLRTGKIHTINDKKENTRYICKYNDDFLEVTTFDKEGHKNIIKIYPNKIKGYINVTEENGNTCSKSEITLVGNNIQSFMENTIKDKENNISYDKGIDFSHKDEEYTNNKTYNADGTIHFDKFLIVHHGKMCYYVKNMEQKIGCYIKNGEALYFEKNEKPDAYYKDLTLSDEEVQENKIKYSLPDWSK